MKIRSGVEKNLENKKFILVEIDADDSKIWNQAIKVFDKYDKDDYKYRARLEDNKEIIHKIWALLHPS